MSRESDLCNLKIISMFTAGSYLNVTCGNSIKSTASHLNFVNIILPNMPRSPKEFPNYILPNKTWVYIPSSLYMLHLPTVHLILLNLIKQTYYLNSKTIKIINLRLSFHLRNFHLQCPQYTWSNENINQLSYINFSGYSMYRTL